MCLETVSPRPFKRCPVDLTAVIGLGVSLCLGALYAPPVNGVRLRPRSSAGYLELSCNELSIATSCASLQTLVREITWGWLLPGPGRCAFGWIQPLRFLVHGGLVAEIVKRRIGVRKIMIFRTPIRLLWSFECQVPIRRFLRSRLGRSHSLPLCSLSRVGMDHTAGDAEIYLIVYFYIKVISHHLLHQKQNQCEHLTSNMRKTLCETTVPIPGSDGRVV